MLVYPCPPLIPPPI